MMSVIISIVQIVIVPLVIALISIVIYIYKKTEDRVTKIECKLDRINPQDLEKISLIKETNSTLTIEFTNLKEDIKDINDNLKSLEAYLDKVSCNSLESCGKIFQSKENSLTPELLRSMLKESFAEFELKLFKEGYLTATKGKTNDN